MAVNPKMTIARRRKVEPLHDACHCGECCRGSTMPRRRRFDRFALFATFASGILGRMGKSRKRKKDRAKRRKRSLGAKRLAAIDRIERARTREPQPVAKAAQPISTPVVRPAPEAAKQIAIARQMGLSVADDTSVDRVAQLLMRHELAVAYVHRVWAALNTRTGSHMSPTDEQLRRVAAGLFGDGRVADGVVAAQKQHLADDRAPLLKDGSYRRVAAALRERFGQLLPKRSLLSRLLGR